MKAFNVAVEEWQYEEYRAMIDRSISEIVENIITGKKWARDNQNLLKNLPMDVMYPPLSWVEMLPRGLETWIEKIQREHEDNVIADYYFIFKSKTVGGPMDRGSLFVTYGWIKTK